MERMTGSNDSHEREVPHFLHLTDRESMEGEQSVSTKFSGINYKIISLTVHYMLHYRQRKRLRLVTPLPLSCQLVSVSLSL